VGEISDRFRITGDFSESEVRFMTALLRTGKFPVRLKPEPGSEKNVPPAR
jgi:preprotein translocase subunit SecD